MVVVPLEEPKAQTATSEKPSAATASNVVSVVPAGQPAAGTKSMVTDAGGGGGGGDGGLTGVLGAPGDEISVSEHAASVRMATLAIVASFKVLRSFMSLPSRTPAGCFDLCDMHGSSNPLGNLMHNAGLWIENLTISKQFGQGFVTSQNGARNLSKYLNNMYFYQV
jgi:hypothetical protein